jgi:hypothetical protein
VLDVLKELLAAPTPEDEDRRPILASRDFYEAGSYRKYGRTIEAEFGEKLTDLVARAQGVLGPPSIEESAPDWFMEALRVVSWDRPDRRVFLALHHDDKELPFMITIGAGPVPESL